MRSSSLEARAPAHAAVRREQAQHRQKRLALAGAGLTHDPRHSPGATLSERSRTACTSPRARR